MIAAVAEGDAGADHRFVEPAARRDAHPPFVDEGAATFFRPEHFVAHRLVDATPDHFLLPPEDDRNREEGQAVQEIRRAVEGIDDPAMAAIGAWRVAALFHGE